jgi:TP901 family phage tail tape measure protein
MNNATLNIVVRVAARQAQQQLAATAAAARSVGAASGSMASQRGWGTMQKNMAGYLTQLQAAAKAQANFSAQLANSNLVKHGKNLNWVGRQLTFNFTLPLALAGAALFKFNMDIERSMTQVRKVYGDLSMSQEDAKAQTDALSKSFELLSTRFGVHQAEVIDIAAAWASAGSAGRGLAENVKATLQVMILGELESAKATESLIAIQAQWRLSTYDVAGGVSELTSALAVMNIVENETGVTMDGLIEVFERASGSARAAGVTIDELAAFAAALVPATGGAAQAGNALKTIFSRLQAPTQQAADLLEEIGFTVSDPSWLGSTATEKLMKLADQWDELSTSQRSYASSILASRWQVSRFDVLMDDLSSGVGYYAKALEAASDPARNLAVYEKELLTVLESNPRRWDIMTNAVRNSLGKAFLPLIPAIMSLVGLFANLATAFSNLDPNIQKWILFGLAIVAVVGPIMTLAGSLMQLVGVFGVFGKMLVGITGSILIPVFKLIGLSFIKLVLIPIATAIPAIASAVIGLGAPFWIVVGIIALAGAAIAAVMYTDIEEPIWRALESVARGLTQLPQLFVEVFNAVIRVLGQQIAVVVDLLSYLNPFQRHSPSLVDNVRAGVSTILDEYAKLKTIPATVARALASLGAFTSVSSNDIDGFRRTKQDAVIADISKSNPEAGAAAARMLTDIRALEAALIPLTAEIDAQARIVDELSLAYAAAGRNVDQAERHLAALSAQLEAVGTQITDAKSRLGELANMPITGMREMEDQIFANSMAQKELTLRLLEFERAGMSIDKIRDKWAALNGDIEMLRGKREELRLAGAGSDVLGAYDAQIAALEEQKTGLAESANEIQNIQDELDRLDLEGQFLELTQSITFDPLVRQIEQAVSGLEEMDFEEIIAGIQEQQAIIAELEPQYEAIAVAEEAARAAVEAAKLEREIIGEQLDSEQEKLDALEAAYTDIGNLIREMESAMSDYVSAAEAAAAITKTKEEQGGESLFAAGEGVDYEIAGGDSVLGTEGGLADIEAFNAEMEAEVTRMLEEMGNIDLFAFVQESIDKLKGYKDDIVTWFKSIPQWIRDNWGRLLLGALAVAFAISFGPLITIMLAGLGYAFTQLAEPVAGWVYDNIVKPVVDGFLAVGTWLGENVVTPILEFLVNLGLGMQSIWDTNIFPILDAIWKFMVQVGEGIAWVWTDIIYPAIQTQWDLIKTIFQAVVDFINAYLIPIFQLFAVIFEIVFVTIGRIIQAWWGAALIIFNAIDWTIRNVLWPVFSWIGQMITWVFREVIGPVVNWLLDEVFSPIFTAIGTVVSDAWDGMFELFAAFRTALGPIQTALQWLYNSVIRPIMEAIGTVFQNVWNGIATVIATGINAFITGFNLLAGAVNAVASLLNIDSRVGTMEHIDLGSIKFNADFSGADALVNKAGKAQGGAGGGVSPMLAMGGVVGAMGGAVKGARAIVGEGSDIHPEYVIPTDPRYRSRARGLYSELGHVFGEDEYGRSNMDVFGIGSAIGSGISAARGAIGSVGGFLKDKAVSAIWTPARMAADAAINRIPVDFIKRIGRGIFDGVDGWITGADQVWNEEAVKRNVPTPTAGAGSWKAITAMLTMQGIPYKTLSTFRPGAVTRNTGNQSWHALDRAVDLSGPSGMINYNHADMLKINHAIYDTFKPYLKELIYGGAGAKNVLRGQDHEFSSALKREHVNHVHAALARGGFVVPRTTGGSLFRIGEGLHNEAVQVTPLQGGKGGSGTGGETTIHFHGELVFPNIRSGEDAERFIKNLEALAGVSK